MSNPTPKPPNTSFITLATPEELSREHVPYDIIGDIHGCYDELVRLLTELGYVQDSEGFYIHPEGRLFGTVGDLSDRGKDNVKVIQFFMKHVSKGLAFCVQGNHDNKCARFLKGNDVKISHGLETTVKELELLSDEERSDICEFLLNLPLYLELDHNRLLICHAAPPTTKSTRRNKSLCLYGHVTGKNRPDGLPERLNWSPSYDLNDETYPFVVYGHVTHVDAYMTEKTCCVDTGCFTGNKLTSLRWPEKEIVSVPSNNPYDEDVSLKDPNTYKGYLLSKMDTDPITTYHLPTLLQRFKDNEAKVLELIDYDPDLSKRECPQTRAVIANARKGMFDLEHEHQLYAKGIVYQRNPYRLVSIPLIKMQNRGFNDVANSVTEDMIRHKAKVVLPDKLDGTCVFVFECKGQVKFATRSVMEGVVFDRDSEDMYESPYIEAARQIAAEKYPFLLNANFVKGFTLVFELIHPVSENVTRYGDVQDLFLISIFDHKTFSYKTTSWVKSFAAFHEIPKCDVISEGEDFDSCLVEALSVLDKMDNIPEGVIVEFHDDEQILHRVKVKTEEYIEAFALRHQCSLKNVTHILWWNPEYQDWDQFETYLKSKFLNDDELLDKWRCYHTEYVEWYKGIEVKMKEIEDVAKSHPPVLTTMKDIAAHFMGHKDFGLIMSFLRGKLRFEDVAFQYNNTPALRYIAITPWEG